MSKVSTKGEIEMIIRRNNKIVSNSSSRVRPQSKYIKAAGEDDFGEFDDELDDDQDGLVDAIDNVADNVEDLQDSIDDIEEDEPEIAMNNNIADHFIAECDRCHGIFISAVVDSDQDIDYVTGTCPLCGRDTDQYLKWVIKSIE